MEKAIARVEPAERGKKEESVGAQLFARELKMLTRGQNALLADQPVDLEPERNECDQVDRAERADKEIAASEVSRPANFARPKQAGKERGQPAITGNHSIRHLGDWREARDVVVTPNHPAPAAHHT